MGNDTAAIIRSYARKFIVKATASGVTANLS
jgi:hypothetical protein